MPTFARRIPVLALLAPLLFVAGCDKEVPSYPITGKVTLDGTPLKEGEINFVADDGKTALATGPVNGGAFSFPAKAGKKKVQIYARKLDSKTGMFNDILPPKYNSESELTAEVTAGGPNSFTFDLKSR